MRISQACLSVLNDTFLFKGLSTEQVSGLIDNTVHEISLYAKDTDIYSVSNFRKALGIIISGKVRVLKAAGSLTVSELKKGDLFGAASLFNEEQDYVCELKALSSCRVLFFTQEAVEQMIADNAIIRKNYIRYLSGRIRFLSDKVDSLIRSTGNSRLYNYFLQNMDDNGNFLLSCSYSQLATRFNMGRATLYRELSRLEENGYIIKNGKNITVMKKENVHE